MKNSTLLALIPVAMMSSFAFADLPESDDATQAMIDQAAAPKFLLPQQNVSGESTVSATATKQGKKKAISSASSSYLPFWGDEARALGYELPEPFGIGVNYMNMRQNIVVDSIKLTGLPLNLDKLLNIGVGHTREKSKTESVKLDAWILPFLNIYGLVGHTKGTSSTKITSVKLGSFPIKVPAGTSFDLDFKGTTYGGGATLVGGYNNWFSAIDANYTETRFDILDGSISAFTLTPRLGYRFTTPGIDMLNLAPGKLNAWIGSMYQDVQQEFRGNLSDLNLPSSLTALAKNGRFDVKQHLQSPWNVLLGAQYEITRNFNLITEFGFAERNSFFVSGEYRF
ncbi:hypothetical protein [Hafnia paralvei]|uniref:hypothetical protein n=1 Tax=Hafnia paralvei TaxID=546367 RepID=UPI00103422AB|nr:hypothetical protein [Hafnia paralvei]TBL97459.1 hypothetical protein EYY93_19415 [Hafnia paralvei]UBM41108.1 hypothetical protein K9N75_01025 [Hafnia paralvei]